GSFAEQFVWMELVLDRTETISLQEKERIKEALQVYDVLWESHPKVKQLRAEIAASKAQGRAEGRAEGKAEGKAEGELREARRIFVGVVKVRFPALAELAEQEAAKITNAGAIELLVQRIVAAPNEDIARWLLSPPVA